MSDGPSGSPQSSRLVKRSVAPGERGALLLEAVVAAFLMVFAFATAAALFDRAVQWEADATSSRRASMIAERRLEELRSATSAIPSGSSFSAVLSGFLGSEMEYSDDPGFVVKVEELRNQHREVQTSGLTPTDGVHSPCASLFTAIPTLTSNEPDGNPQLNNRYSTYPYSRHIPNSLRLIQVTVSYSGGTKEQRLVSLLGDPILPFDNSPDVIVTRTSGPANLNNFDVTADYTAQVVTANGSEPQDVTILWSASLDSTGALSCIPLDSTGRSVRVRRRTVTPLGAGARAKVQALVRYGAQEAVGLSAEFQLP